MARLSKDVLLALRRKKAMHSQWKLGHVTWEVEGCGLRVCRGGMRKTKAQIGMGYGMWQGMSRVTRMNSINMEYIRKERTR